MGFLAFLLLAGSPAFAISFDCVQGDEHLGRKFLPGCEGRIELEPGKAVSYRNNSLGLSAREYSREPAKGAFRVLFVGPSSFVSYSAEREKLAAYEKALGESKPPAPYTHYELLNASEPENTILYSYLRLPELLRAYEPRLVVYFDGFSSYASLQVFQQRNATVDPASGLISSFGWQHSFWPLPRSWDLFLWEKAPRGATNFLRAFSVGARTALLRWRIALGGVAFPRERNDLSAFVELDLRYLEAMRALSEKAGAGFVVAYVPPLPRGEISRLGQVAAFFRNQFAWYRSFSWAQLLAPWTEELDPDENKVLQKEIAARFRHVAVEGVSLTDSESYLHGDLHYAGTTLERMGASLAAGTIRALAAVPASGAPRKTEKRPKSLRPRPRGMVR